MGFVFLLAWLAVLLTGGLALLSAWRWVAIRTRPAAALAVTGVAIWLSVGIGCPRSIGP